MKYTMKHRPIFRLMKRLFVLILTCVLLCTYFPAMAAYKLSDDGKISDGMILFYDQNNKKYGYFDVNGSIVIPPQYAIADAFQDGTAAVSLKNPPSYFIIDKQNNTLMKAPDSNYELQSPLINGGCVALLWKKKKNSLEKQGYVLLNEKGKVITPKPLMYATTFNEDGLALVGEGSMPKKKSMIASSGNTFFIQYPSGNGYAQAATKYYFINTSGKKVGDKYNFARPFSEGLAAVCKEKINGAVAWGFINKKGHLVIEAQYDEVGDFCQGMAIVTQNGKRGFIRTDGSVVVNPQYDAAYNFSDGMAAVAVGAEDSRKYGYVDAKGKLVIEPQFDYGGSFKNGLAPAKDRLVYGLIDKSGEWVISPRYEKLYALNHTNLYEAKEPDSACVYSDTGELITLVTNGKSYADGTPLTKVELPMGDFTMTNFMDDSGEFVSINSFRTDIKGDQFVVRNGSGLYGLIDEQGNTIVSPTYDYISASDDDSGILLTKSGERYGYLAVDGTVLIDVIYDKASAFNGVGIAWQGDAWYLIQEDGSPIDIEARMEATREHTDKATVKAAQEALNASGYDCGQPDGATGKKTKEAILAYQQDHGLTQTGTVTSELLETLSSDKQSKPAQSQATELREESILDSIIPNGSVWGMTADALKETYNAEYKQCQVGEAKALCVSDVEVCSYHMDVFYVFGEEATDSGLSKIVYVLSGNASYTDSELDQCLQTLIEKMKTTVGNPDKEQNGTTIWKKEKYKIELGKGRLSKYIGSDKTIVALIFKKV